MQYAFPAFENLCPSWDKILHLGIRRNISRGSLIFDLETPVNGIYYVKKGLVEIFLYTSHGPEKVLYYVGQGCIFGEVSCFVTGESGEASVRARTDCILYFFSREVLENTITGQYPHYLLELLSAAAYKIRMYGVLLRDSLNSNHFIRVCRMIAYLVRYTGIEVSEGQKKVVTQTEMTQTDIARLLGVHRVTVTKAVGRLKEMGIIQHFTKRALVITDFQRLLELIEDEERENQKA
jgi:CRP-like cAMP-binding protein